MNARHPLQIGLLVLGVLLGAAFSAQADERTPVVPDGERASLSTQIRDLVARSGEHSRFPLPDLDDERLAALFDGEVIRFMEKHTLDQIGDEPREQRRMYAFRLVPESRNAVWIASVDPHFLAEKRVTEVRLNPNRGYGSTWWQHMDLPWPVKDRHWVIRVREEHEVAKRSGGHSWEHTWQLVSGGRAIAMDLATSGRTNGISADDIDDSRYLEANDGAWTLVTVDDELTLLAYQLTIVLGGWIPDGLAAKFAMSTLESLLDTVAANAAKVPAHYGGDHTPIFGGDGAPVPYFVAP